MLHFYFFFFKQKTAYEISVSEVELQRVEPAARCRLRRSRKDLDDVRDVARGHLFRQSRVRRVRDWRRRDESPPTLSERSVDTSRARLHRSPAAGVTELQRHATSSLVDPLHGLTQHFLPCSIDNRCLGRDAPVLG